MSPETLILRNVLVCKVRLEHDRLKAVLVIQTADRVHRYVVEVGRLSRHAVAKTKGSRRELVRHLRVYLQMLTNT